MNTRFESNVKNLLDLFDQTKNLEEKYRLIMDLGKALPKMPKEQQTESNKVSGCQSVLYLYTCMEDGYLCFTCECDALISKGLAAILIKAYEGLTPLEMLQSEPNFIKELDVIASISINRSNGLANIYQKIKKQSLTLLASASRNS